MKSKGFTLIELAVVIAIIAILAAVAIPRFGNAAGQAECSKVKDLASQLTSAASIYTAEQASTPTGFSDFVTNNAVPAPPFTMSVNNFNCSIAANQITNCAALQYYNPTYTWNAGGAITLTRPVATRRDAPVCD